MVLCAQLTVEWGPAVVCHRCSASLTTSNIISVVLYDIGLVTNALGRLITSKDGMFT